VHRIIKAPAPAGQALRRLTADQWQLIRDQINREHRSIAALNPRSPRVKPTLGPLVWEDAR